MDIILVRFTRYFKDEIFIDYFYYFINFSSKRFLILSTRSDRLVLLHKRFSHKFIKSFINRPEWYRFHFNINEKIGVKESDLYRLLNAKYFIDKAVKEKLEIVSQQKV